MSGPSCQAVIYGFKYDGHLKSFIKMHKPIAEAFDSGALRGCLDEVEQALTKDNAPVPRTGADDGEDGDTADPLANSQHMPEESHLPESVACAPKTEDQKVKLAEWVDHAWRQIKEGVRVVAQQQLATIKGPQHVGKWFHDLGLDVCCCSSRAMPLHHFPTC